MLGYVPRSPAITCHYRARVYFLTAALENNGKSDGIFTRCQMRML